MLTFPNLRIAFGSSSMLYSPLLRPDIALAARDAAVGVAEETR